MIQLPAAQTGTTALASAAAAPPTISGFTPNSGPATGGTQVSLIGTGFTGATAVHFGGVPATGVTVLSDTQITATTPPGAGAAQVTVTTPSGTSAQSVFFVFTPPQAPSLAGLNPTSGPAAGGTTVTLTGSNFSGATQVKFGATNATFTVISNSQINATAPAGTGTVQVTVTTPTGTSNGRGYTYSAGPAPVINTLNPPSGPITGGNTVTITGTNLTLATSVRFGLATATFTVLSPTQINATAPPGTGTVAVNVTTTAGTSNNLAYTYAVTPLITGVSPLQGPASGGNSVTLSGSGLTGATGVTFGGVPASGFTVVSGTQINAVPPPGAPGPVAVEVTTPAGTSGPGAFYFYVAAPVATELNPAAGPAAGGNTVTITGSNLTLATSVHFGVATALFSVLSDNQVKATAPPGTGNVPVNVTSIGGTSNNLTYTYIAGPVISGLNLALGAQSGGNTVTITGSGLTTTTAVHFGPASAGFTVLSPTQVTAVVPPGTGDVPVNVTTTGGTSNSLTYTHVPPPA
ncbi:IPT/TIG domain-containing protein [Streptomyces sp. NPDC004647]|uniref:beta strand repeat-containing protein n=1 Tax=Streptomyces sp. NPDC004647 TaxID=3154671 RepID=UPI0033B5CD9C